MTSANARRDEAGPAGGAATVPRHVAIIMDGNGRWAAARSLPRIAGHRAGVEAARRTVRAAGDLGLEVLTLYAFSSENWRRPADEIADLMGLLRRFVRAELQQLIDSGIRLRVIGDYHALEPDLVAMIDEAIDRTAGHSGTTLAVALNYGSQDEIVRAARSLATRAAAGEIAPADIDTDAVEAALDTAGIPPPDLVIRTSGERRLSNFLMWQAAYAELLFVDTLWPDFDHDALASAIDDYGRRTRRFGGI